MEVEAYEYLSSKKTYKKGSLMNVPNTGFSKPVKKSIKDLTQSATVGTVLKPVQPRIDKEKARKNLDEQKGKVASMPRYNLT